MGDTTNLVASSTAFTYDATNLKEFETANREKDAAAEAKEKQKAAADIEAKRIKDLENKASALDKRVNELESKLKESEAKTAALQRAAQDLEARKLDDNNNLVGDISLRSRLV